MYHESTPRARPPGLLHTHLDLLGKALGRLAGETRLALARAVAVVASSLVNEAVANALDLPGMRQRHESWGQREWSRLAASHDDPYEPCDDPVDDYWEDDDFDPDPGLRRATDRPVATGGSAALALGLRVTALWLNRRGNFSVLSALALGAMAAIGAAGGGPVVLSGLGVVEAVLSLHEMSRPAVKVS